MRYHYDLLVIGSGSAGFAAAQAGRGSGRKIALVESDRLGGECPNWGCVPTKALLASAKQLRASQAWETLGLYGAEARMNFTEVMRRKDALVAGLTGKRLSRVADALGIDVLRGRASFLDPHTLHVGTREVTAERFVIATGSAVRVPSIPGLEGVAWWSFKDAVSAARPPASLIVVGGGPVGVELATFFSAAGTKVFLVQGAPQLLEREEPEIANVIKDSLEKFGVEILMKSEVLRVMAAQKGLEASVRAGTQMRTLQAEHLLLATGKVAEVSGLGISAAGVELDARGWVKTNAELRTTAKHIWAAGDVTGGMLFTHIAHAEGALAGTNAFAKKPSRIDLRVAPRVTFSDPEVASVGLTEAEAKKAGSAVVTSTFPIASLGRAYVEGKRIGLIKLVVDTKTRKVLGGHIASERAGEMIHEIALAMKTHTTVDALASMIHAYPTYSEAISAAAGLL